MIGVEAILMFFLELTLVMVTLCLLLRLRNSVGTSSFTILIGALIIFGEFMMAGRVGLKSGNIHGIELLMPLQWVVLRPCLAVILLVYITDGVLAAQRIIVGVLISLGLFFYLCKLTQFQENNLPYPLSFFGPSAELNNILEAFSALAISEILLLLLASMHLVVLLPSIRKYIRVEDCIQTRDQMALRPIKQNITLRARTIRRKLLSAQNAIGLVTSRRNTQSVLIAMHLLKDIL